MADQIGDKDFQLGSGTAEEVSRGDTEFRIGEEATKAEPSLKKQKEEMPEPTLGEAVVSGAKELIPSTGRAVKQIYEAVTSPIETAKAIGQLGTGAISKAKGALGVQQAPAEKAQNEAVINALLEHYKESYGSWGGFKKALAKDPASVLMDVSLPLTLAPTGGAALGIRGAGVAGKTLELAGKAGAAIDPIQQAVNVAKFTGKKIGKGATEVQSVFTGAPSSALQVAKAAGSSADPAVREVFTKYLRGEGDAMDMAMTAQKALDAVRKDASDAYLTSKSGLAAAAAPMTDFSKIDTAITDARNVIQPSGIKHPSLYADAKIGRAHV